MASSQVPKFGSWPENEGDVAYTEYFDNARKDKKERKPSQDDARDLPESEVEDTKKGSNDQTSREDAESKRSGDSYSRDEGDRRRSNDSLPREAATRKTSSDSPHHRHGGLSASDTPRRVGRQGAGSDRSVEHSPLHPQSQPKTGGKGGGFSSPSWERKVSSEGTHGQAPATPGRSRLRSVTRGDDTPDDSPAIPKFGEWDENDPASTEEFTQIFNKVREEKQTGGGKVPVLPTESSHPNSQKRDGNDSSKRCGCFPCFGR